MIARYLAVVLCLCLAIPAWAGPPDLSPRPQMRALASADATARQPDTIRPALRPISAQVTRAAQLGFMASVPALEDSLRPALRPESIVEAFLFRKRQQRKGSVCGNIDIQGEVVGKVPGRKRGCGIDQAVRVTSVSGVRLSTPALMNCPTAQALNTWTAKGLKPAFRLRGPVVEMRVAAHYACRTRNNQPGAKLSEHAKGNAIDLSAFTMKDGEVITVLKGWGQGTTAKPLREIWRAACGPFGTVLGPKANRFHRDHFHFDTARYRSGAFCR